MLSAEPGHADVAAVFSSSYDAVSAPAARLFRLLGIHPGPDISLLAAASLGALDLDQARRVLDELTGASLVTEPAPGRYLLHDLLRAYAAERAEAQDAARRAASRPRPGLRSLPARRLGGCPSSLPERPPAPAAGSAGRSHRRAAGRP